MAKLTPKQERFIQEYLIDLNGTQAAIRAGYSAKTAQEQSARLLSKAIVKDRLSHLQQKKADRLEITADRVIAEIAKVAFADMGDYVTITADGTPLLDFRKMPEGGTKAVSQIEQEVYYEGAGDDATPVKKTKFRLHDKLNALEKLGKHLGLFRDKVELTGKDGADLNMGLEIVIKDFTTSTEAGASPQDPSD